MVKKAVISAPAKVIISGEHAVVYGYPALVAAINRRIFLTFRTKVRNSSSKNLIFRPNGRGCQMLDWEESLRESFVFEIESEIPFRCGLGSSAALAATQAAVLVYLRSKNLRCTQETTPGVVFSRHLRVVNEIAFGLEKISHGNPSGVDNTIITFGGILLFQKGKKPKAIRVKKLPEFLLVNTGRAEETTKKMIESLKCKMQNAKLQLKIKNLLNSIGQLPAQFIKALQKENFSQLKWLITKNQRLLEELGVVGERAKKAVHLIEQLGGAAKICGAGGLKKGSGVVLVYHENLAVIEKFCQKERLEFFRVELGEEGVRVER